MDHAELIELVARAKAGDVGARNAVVEANIGLVVAVARRFGRRPAWRWAALDLADLVQIGAIRLLECVPGYDPARGEWDDYAANCIRHALVRAVARRHVPADPMDPADLAEVTPTEDPGRRRFEAAHDVAAGLPLLRPRDREALSLRYGLDGDGPLIDREIAARVRVSRQTISTRIGRAQRRMRAFVEG